MLTLTSTKLADFSDCSYLKIRLGGTDLLALAECLYPNILDLKAQTSIALFPNYF